MVHLVDVSTYGHLQVELVKSIMILLIKNATVHVHLIRCFALTYRLSAITTSVRVEGMPQVIAGLFSIPMINSGMVRTVHLVAHAVSSTTHRGSLKHYPTPRLTTSNYVCAVVLFLPDTHQLSSSNSMSSNF